MTQQTHPFLRRLPDGLADLALDLRWTWNHATDRLWEALAPDIWKFTGNPWLILQSVSQSRLEQLAAAAGFRDELGRLMPSRIDTGSTYASGDRRRRRRAMPGGSVSRSIWGTSMRMPSWSSAMPIRATRTSPR